MDERILIYKEVGSHVAPFEFQLDQIPVNQTMLSFGGFWSGMLPERMSRVNRMTEFPSTGQSKHFS